MFGFAIASLFVIIATSFEWSKQPLSEPVAAARVIAQAAGILCFGLAISLS